MNEVDRLVEWTAETMCNRDEKLGECYGCWKEVEELTRKEYRVTAKKILSHPDLALIDRHAKRGNLLVWDIIPLAEALKEE